MRLGVRLFHADPIRDTAWRRRLSEAQIRLWKDPIFILNRPDTCFYKNRFVPGLDEEKVVLLTAGWEYRTILLLLHYGIPYSAMAHDDRTPPVLQGTMPARDTGTFKYDHDGAKKSYFPDHAVDFIPQSLEFLKAMGIPDNVVDAYRAAPGAASFFSLETKCKGGMLHLGNFDEDLAKLKATGRVANSSGILRISWSPSPPLIFYSKVSNLFVRICPAYCGISFHKGATSGSVEVVASATTSLAAPSMIHHSLSYAVYLGSITPFCSRGIGSPTLQ